MSAYFFNIAPSKRLIDDVRSQEMSDSVETDKKKAVTGIFLETFVAKGLGETTSRDLAKALNLQSGGLYYYFESKDAAIVACAEEAMARLEQELIVPALEEVAFPDKMISNTKKRAKALAPTMGFLTQVCASPKFGPLMKDRVEALFDRYDYYAAKVAEKLGCCHESAAS